MDRLVRDKSTDSDKADSIGMDAQLPASRHVVTEPGAPRVPEHRLLTLIGGGSYGQIWLARNIMGAYRAVKVVSRSRFQSERPYEREFEGLQRFEPISRSHEGFLQILHIGRNDEEGYFYYVMELGESDDPAWKEDTSRYRPRTLATELEKKGRLPLDRCLEIALALSEACSRLHQQGLVHRDLKPANLVFVGDRPKLADIGLVTEAGPGATFVGTEGYVPAEGPGHATADLYALGKILYEISTGRSCEDYPLLPDQLPESVGPVSFAELNAIICKCCEEDPALRYQSAEELRLHLSLLRAGTSVRRLIRLGRALGQLQQQWVPLLLGVVALAAIGFSILRGFRHAEELRRSESEVAQRKMGGFLARGNQAMEQGDYTAALPWFSAALSLADRDPALAETHRTRLATALQRSPRIISLWTSDREARNGSFTADPDRILVQGAAGRFHLASISTGEILSPPFGSQRGEESVALDRLGDRAVTGSRRESIARLWEVSSGRSLREIPFPNYLTDVRLNGAGDTVAVGMVDGTVGVHFLANAQTVTLSGHRKGQRVLHVAFSRDGGLLLSTSEDGQVLVWNVATRSVMTRFEGHGTWVNWASFSPDGSMVASAGFDARLRIWKTISGQPVQEISLTPHQVIRSVEFDPTGNRLITSDFDFTVRMWDLQGHQAGVPLHHGAHVVYAAYSADAQRVLSVTQDGTTRVWQLPQAIAESKMEAMSDYQPAVGASLEIAAGAVTFRSPLGTDKPRRWGSPFPGIQAGWLSRRGDRALLVSEEHHGTIDLGRERELAVVSTDEGRRVGSSIHVEGSLQGAEIGSAGEEVLLWWQDGVELRSVESGERRWRFEIPDQKVRSATMSRTGRWIAVAYTSETGDQVYLLDARTGRPAFAPFFHPSPVRFLAFSPAGDLLAVACLTPLARAEAAFVWNTASGKPQGPPLYHRDGVLHVAFSPDGRRLATCGEDRHAMLWDSHACTPLLAPLVHRDQVIRAVFNRNGGWLATLTSGSVARVWDAATGDPVTPELSGFEVVTDLAFSTDSQRLLAWKPRGLDGRNGVLLSVGLPRESRPAEDLSSIAKLISGGSYDLSGGLVPSRPEDLKEAWHQLRARYPGEFSVAPSAPFVR